MSSVMHHQHMLMIIIVFCKSLLFLFTSQAHNPFELFYYILSREFAAYFYSRYSKINILLFPLSPATHSVRRIQTFSLAVTKSTPAEVNLCPLHSKLPNLPPP